MAGNGGGAELNVDKHKFHLNFTSVKPEGATFPTASRPRKQRIAMRKHVAAKSARTSG